MCIRKRLAGLSVAASVAVLTTPAQAATRSCGTETALSRGAIFKIQATGVACATAKSVAGGWYSVQSQGETGRVVFDVKARRWSCRITEAATGTDPGFNPHTSIRCVRRSSVVRFKLRS